MLIKVRKGRGREGGCEPSYQRLVLEPRPSSQPNRVAVARRGDFSKCQTHKGAP